MKPPRELIELFIIDSEATSAPLGEFAVAGRYEAPRGIQLVDYQLGETRRCGISRWREAISYWLGFEPRSVPDLIVADIRYESDDTTPLKHSLPKTTSDIPTGLSHAKPFIAVSRALGRPIGIAVYTVARNLWLDLWQQCESSGHVPENPTEAFEMGGVKEFGKRMSLLAAHEAGEVAAILGEDLSLPDTLNLSTLQKCWTWIASATETTHERALRRAIEDYRRRLLRFAGCGETQRESFEAGSIFVLPNEWTELRCWCEAMGRNPKPLTPEIDPGLALTWADGNQDRIYLHSLFADAWGLSLDPSRDPLPAHCFELAKDSAPEKLDLNRLPKIGAFVERLGNWNRLYRQAAGPRPGRGETDGGFLAEIPADGSESTRRLVDVIPATVPGAKLVRLLVLFFQAIRVTWWARNQWRELYFEKTWTPQTMVFSNSDADEERHTLAGHVKEAYALLKAYEGAFTWNELQSGLEDGNWVGGIASGTPGKDGWIKLHIDILVGLGCARWDRHGRLSLLKSRACERKLTDTLPPCPDELRLGAVRDLHESLMKSLGYTGNSRANLLARVPGDALFGTLPQAESDRRGRDFMESLLAGTVPGWLRELGRQYAREGLEWPQDAHWPSFLV